MTWQVALALAYLVALVPLGILAGRFCGMSGRGGEYRDCDR